MKELITQFADRIGAKVGTVGENPSGDEVWTSVKDIINAVILVLGTICVVIIIIGGVNYMTSSGDTSKVKKAKDTILYALIGLVVCVLAFAIVNWVIVGVLGNSK